VVPSMGSIGGIEVLASLGKMRDLISKITKSSQAPVAHACNPSYLGGRDQEDCGFLFFFFFLRRIVV
jgi:hypothetical protein